MTLSAQIGRTIFTGNGSTTQFSYGQRFYDPSELKVVHYDTTTLTETALTGGQYDLDYSGASPYNSATITYPLAGAPMAATEQLIVYRSPALTQDADLTNQSAYFLTSLENQLDQLTTFVQNMQDQLNRALVLPVSTPTGKKITMGPPVGEAVLRWPDDVSGDCVLESVDIIDLIIDDSRTQQVIELAFEGQLFNDAWAREFGLVCAGALNTGFNADQVDGYDVLAGTTPASGLLKVGDYGVGGAIDISGMDLDNLSTAGSYHGDTLTNAPFASEWFIDVITAGTEITQRAAEVGNAEIIYSRAYNSGGAVWSEWFIVWAGASGSLLSGLNADQVDGYDVDSSPVPNAGLIKAGDWGATWQTLDFSGFSMDINNTVNFHGTNLGNAPDTGKFFVTTLGDGTDSVQTASDPVSGEVRRRYNTGGAWSAWSAPVTFDDHTHTEVDITDLDKYTQGEIDTALGFKADLSLVGAASGICPLDAGGLVDSAYLPSYVDDVIEAADYASLPGTGETGKIYVTLDNGNIYRWTGAAYIEINTSVGTADEAIALATPRNIALGGDATGSANFDGTANITITANVLDSDALGGVAAENYLRSDVVDSVGGVLTFAAAPVLNNNVLLSAWDTSPALRTIAGINGSNQLVYGNTNLALALFSNGTLTHNGAMVWTSGNDGLGSALDAGLLGGALPSAYATLAGTQTFSGVNTFSSNLNHPLRITGTDSGKILLSGATDPYIEFRESSTTKGYVQWSSAGFIFLNNLEDGSRLRIKDTLDFSDDAGVTYYNIYHTGNSANLAKLDSANIFTANQTVRNSSVGGIAPNSNADNLVLEESGDTVGLTIKSDNTETVQILFADSDSNSAGYVRYAHASDTLTLSATGSSAISVNSSGLLFGTDTVYHTGNDSNLAKKYSGTVIIPDTSTYQTVATVTGGTGISSGIKLFIKGTQSGVVVDVSASILASSSADIVIESTSTSYTQIYIQAVSNGSDSFDIKLRGTAPISNLSCTLIIYPLSDETVAFTTTGSYSTTTNTHLTQSATRNITAVGGTTAYTVEGNTVYHAGNDSNLAKLDGTQTFSGVNTFSAAPILNNNIALKGKNTGGTGINIGRVSNLNDVVIGQETNDLILYSVSNPTHYNGTNTETLYHTGNDSSLAKLNANNTFTANQRLANNIYIQGKRVDTANFSILGIDSSDNCIIGTTGLPAIIRSSVNPIFFNGTNTYNIYHAGNDSNLAKLDGTQTFSGVNTFSSTTDSKIILSGSENPTISLRNTAGSNLGYLIYRQSSSAVEVGNNVDGSRVRVKDGIDFTNDGVTYYSLYHTGNDSTLAKINATSGALQLPTLASDPASGASNGQMYYNTTSHVIRAYINGSWADK